VVVGHLDGLQDEPHVPGVRILRRRDERVLPWREIPPRLEEQIVSGGGAHILGRGGEGVLLLEAGDYLVIGRSIAPPVPVPLLPTAVS